MFLKNSALVLLLALFASGCSVIAGPVLGLVDKDLARTEELAAKYGRPHTAECVKYLRSAITGPQALLAEDVDGLISLAFKLYLLKSSQPIAEEQFKEKCGAVAAGLLLELGKSIRR